MAADPSQISTWILSEGRKLRMVELIAGFGRNLVNAGLPVSRMTLHLRQLHPQFYTRGFFWYPGDAEATETTREHGIERTSAYLDSPLYELFQTGGQVRRRLENTKAPYDYPILQELAEAGATDYVAIAMPFRRSEVGQAITLASDRPGGFSDEDLALICALLPAYSVVVELINMERMTEALLATYVGESTGRRVLAGEIRRGGVQRIRAVLWFGDLRDFTAISEALPGEEVIELLNAYFETLAGPIAAAGGEILKFIGDAMLAILPVTDKGENGLRRACETALAAADTAVSATAVLNARRLRLGQRTFQAGLALHVGDVLYGNVGAENRLDFTVIGPAVNLVSRIEQLCAHQGFPLVLSAEFANHVTAPLTSLGEQRLKGIAEPQEVFAPA